MSPLTTPTTTNLPHPLVTTILLRFHEFRKTLHPYHHFPIPSPTAEALKKEGRSVWGFPFGSLSESSLRIESHHLRGTWSSSLVPPVPSWWGRCSNEPTSDQLARALGLVEVMNSSPPPCISLPTPSSSGKGPSWTLTERVPALQETNPWPTDPKNKPSLLISLLPLAGFCSTYTSLPPGKPPSYLRLMPPGRTLPSCLGAHRKSGLTVKSFDLKLRFMDTQITCGKSQKLFSCEWVGVENTVYFTIQLFSSSF